MSDTSKTDRESVWVHSEIYTDFQCVHIEVARQMELLLREAIEKLRCYSNNDVLGIGGDMMIEKISKYLDISPD